MIYNNELVLITIIIALNLSDLRGLSLGHLASFHLVARPYHPRHASTLPGTLFPRPVPDDPRSVFARASRDRHGDLWKSEEESKAFSLRHELIHELGAELQEASRQPAACRVKMRREVVGAALVAAAFIAAAASTGRGPAAAGELLTRGQMDKVKEFREMLNRRCC